MSLITLSRVHCSACSVLSNICTHAVTSVGQIRSSSKPDIYLQAGFEEFVFSGILIGESTGLRSKLSVCVHKLECILEPSRRVFFC